MPEQTPGLDGDLPGDADGELLVGRYRVGVEIGKGGEGIVYRGVDIHTGRAVAIKKRAAAAGGFEAERRYTIGFSHPNVPQVLDSFVTPEGGAYLVREYVDGVPLRAMISPERPFPPAEAAEIVLQVTRVVADLHRHRRFHRDLKPENVLVTPERKAYLTDFGSAIEEELLVLREGGVVTTPPYATPAALTGTTRQVYRWSEVYALGLILYELLTGERLINDTSKEGSLVAGVVLSLHPPELPAGVPAVLRDVFRLCLRSSTRGGYLTADDLAEDLAAFLATGALPTHPRRPRLRYYVWKLAQSLSGACAQHGRHARGLDRVALPTWQEDLLALLPVAIGVPPLVRLRGMVPFERTWPNSLALIVGQEIDAHSAFDEAVYWAGLLGPTMSEITKERHDYYHNLVRRPEATSGEDIARLKGWAGEMTRFLAHTIGVVEAGLTLAQLDLFRLRFRLSGTGEHASEIAEEWEVLPEVAMRAVRSLYRDVAQLSEDASARLAVVDRLVEAVLLYEGP